MPSFVVSLVHTSGGSPSEQNGLFVMESHGRITRVLTAEEYHRQRAYLVRGFSGHWMLFYLFSLSMLYAAMNPPQDDSQMTPLTDVNVTST
jgi:hypothetical protein